MAYAMKRAATRRTVRPMALGPRPAATRRRGGVVRIAVDSGPTLIPAGATAMITLTPQSLAMGPAVPLELGFAPGPFHVQGVYVGVEPAYYNYVTSYPHNPAQVPPTISPVPLHPFALHPGMDLTVGVANVGLMPARFFGIVTARLLVALRRIGRARAVQRQVRTLPLGGR